jgi:ABC-type cobalamin/Fe3+-siderophores transport system ATPase subunit
LRRRGLFELHSGAVIEPASSKGVLIIGPSGSGKSTLTVQLASAGWPFLTDDVLILSANDERVTAWPLRRCFAITDETLASSEFLRRRTSNAQLKGQRDEKKQFLPHEVFGKFSEHCVPRTLIFSQLSGEEGSQVSALSPGETMTRLIRMNPWSCYDQTTAANHLAVLSALVRQARGYAVYAGRDLLKVNIAAQLIASCTRD